MSVAQNGNAAARGLNRLHPHELRDSGVPWLGPIPTHWEVWKLGHLLRLASGETLSGERISGHGPFPVYGGNGLRGYFTEASHHGDYVLIGRQGALCGNINYAHGEFWATEHALVVYPQRNLNLRWLGESLRSMNLNQYSVAAAQPGLSVPNITCLRFAVPPLEEQTQIAKFLDYETAKIDALIEKQQQLIALLKEKRQAVISHAVTKGLDPSAPMKDSGVEWLGKVPAHWKVGKCGFYLRVLSGYAFPSSGFSSSEADIRLLRGINVAVGGVRWDETVRWRRRAGDGLDAWELSEGDLVIGMDRPMISEGVRVAKLGKEDVPSMLLQRVASLQSSPRLNGDYLMRLLSFDKLFEAHFAPETTGVSVPHISPSQVSDFVIPIPPRGEQDAIVKEVEQRLSRLDQLTDKAGAQTTLLRERRTALISAAVTGKIDVRGWKPPPGAGPIGTPPNQEQVA